MLLWVHSNAPPPPPPLWLTHPAPRLHETRLWQPDTGCCGPECGNQSMYLDLFTNTYRLVRHSLQSNRGNLVARRAA